MLLADQHSSTYVPFDTFVDYCQPRWPSVLLLQSSAQDSTIVTVSCLVPPQRTCANCNSSRNTAARVVVMGRKRDHIGPVLKDLHWLPVKERITLKLATTVFKTLSCSEPSYLLELMEDYKPSRSLRSSQKLLLNIPRCRTKIAFRAFSVAAPSVWNSIEIGIGQSDSVASFKRKLKTRLFESSFP